MWIYRERGTQFAVGFVENGRFYFSTFDIFSTIDEAAARVHYLNGGNK